MDNEKFSANVVTITPEGAAKLLESNTRNRKLRKKIVSRLARDMASDNWAQNGESIKISKDGRLIDGQHRLHACIEAGVPFRILLIRGLDDETQKTMDRNFPRAFSDTLHWQGETATAALGGAIEVSMTWDEQGFLNQHRPVHTPNEKLAWLEANPDIREGVKVAATINRAPLRMPVSVMSPFFMRLNRISAEDAAGFVAHLKSGAELAESHPIYRLRSWVFTMNGQKGSLPREDYVAVSIKAWNAWIQDREIRQLTWKRGGIRSEAFPILIDAMGNSYEDLMEAAKTAVKPGRDSFPDTADLANTDDDAEDCPEEIVI